MCFTFSRKREKVICPLLIHFSSLFFSYILFHFTYKKIKCVKRSSSWHIIEVQGNKIFTWLISSILLSDNLQFSDLKIRYFVFIFVDLSRFIREGIIQAEFRMPSLEGLIAVLCAKFLKILSIWQVKIFYPTGIRFFYRHSNIGKIFLFSLI